MVALAQDINNARKNKKKAINGLIFINPPMISIKP
jgi:hypothetical protein